MLKAAILLTAVAILPGKIALAASLQEIKAKGEITIAVKEDYPPFGSRNEAGELIGLEIDLARDVAARLGVKLKLFPVSSVSRLQFLQQDMVDAVLATVSVTDDRKTQAGLIEPYYFASSLALLAPKHSAIASLADLNGKTICTITGAYHNGTLASEAPKANVVASKNLTLAAKALSSQKCAALAAENTRILYLNASQSKRWKNYRVVPLNVANLPWAFAVKSGEEQSGFGRFLSETVRSWHQSGKLVALEKQWLGRDTEWLLAMHKKLK